jgi:hypothetical protein
LLWCLLKPSVELPVSLGTEVLSVGSGGAVTGLWQEAPSQTGGETGWGKPPFSRAS